MSTIDKSIVKQCLFSSTLKEINGIESIDYSFIKASEELKEKIKVSLEAPQRKRKFYPKKLIIALVAIISMCFLITFAASAKFRSSVVSFFAEVYENCTILFIKDTNENNYPTKIETKYEPSYISVNNYEKADEAVGKHYVAIVWKKEGSTIDFSQTIVTVGANITLDTENAECGTRFIGEQEVFYTIKNGKCSVSWFAHDYSFSLSCNESLGWEEVEKMVSSLAPVTD